MNDSRSFQRFLQKFTKTHAIDSRQIEESNVKNEAIKEFSEHMHEDLHDFVMDKP